MALPRGKRTRALDLSSLPPPRNRFRRSPPPCPVPALATHPSLAQTGPLPSTEPSPSVTHACICDGSAAFSHLVPHPERPTTPSDALLCDRLVTFSTVPVNPDFDIDPTDEYVIQIGLRRPPTKTDSSPAREYNTLSVHSYIDLTASVQAPSLLRACPGFDEATTFAVTLTRTSMPATHVDHLRKTLLLSSADTPSIPLPLFQPPPTLTGACMRASPCLSGITFPPVHTGSPRRLMSPSQLPPFSLGSPRIPYLVRSVMPTQSHGLARQLCTPPSNQTPS